MITDKDIDNNSQQLDFERIRILYSNMSFGYLGVASSAAILYLVAVRYSLPEIAELWLLGVIIANVPRVVVSIQFARRLKSQLITPHNVRPWESYMIAFTAVAYLVFASAIFLPYGEHAIVGTVICAFTFMTMATGGVLVLSTSLPATLMYLTVVSAAIVIKFLLLQDWLFTIAAGVVAIGYLQLVKLIVGQSRLLIENISLKIQNGQLALVDPLTNLANRRQLSFLVTKLVPSAQRSGKTFCVIILDIDLFKQYNDLKGHSAGDALLASVANILLACSRSQDLVVRYGGEEFLLVLPQTVMKEAEAVTTRILAAVKEKTDVTFSAGIAEYSKGIDFDELVRQADAALYTAKHNGRDQYVISSSIPQA